MSVLLEYSKEIIRDLIELQPDAEVEKWLFASSPLPIFIILAFYLTTVLWMGPKFMQNRKPYNLKKVLLFFNGFIVIYCMYINYKYFRIEKCMTLLFFPTTIYPTLERKSQIEVCSVVWLYFFSKVIELTDTILFILRKKFNQISFLHVYHHFVMVIFTWSVLKTTPGTQSLPGILNVNVHIVMYTYYFIAALGSKYQKYIWWKKYLTVLQLMQFFVILTYVLMQPITRENRFIAVFNFVNVTVVLGLFGNFYIKSYVVKKQVKLNK